LATWTSCSGFPLIGTSSPFLILIIMAVAKTVTLSSWVNERSLKGEVLFTPPDERFLFIHHERRHIGRQ
jgi:hypothetical protein